MFFPAPNGRGSHALDIMLDDKRERTYVPSPTDSSVKYPRIMVRPLVQISLSLEPVLPLTSARELQSL